ncbi:hypothetical protein DDW05_01540 [Candidatus Nanobsidianus stetteri]|jgi:hypothetical protein|uniref:Uncharacterized protein n=1 Tax=Nanobsidianus stetteri TaxID=1294122 RepID=A0A2T9WTU6_NANST|nr:hypothetical protein DDW05_01540 [Candidatus Nanobsidianus stetteri]
MDDIKRKIVTEIEELIRSNLKYYVSESLEDIINNKNKSSTSYPSEVVFSIAYNKKEFRLDILTRYIERNYIDLYYKREGIEEERRIIYYKDGKRNKEVCIKNAYITPDKYIIPIVRYREKPIFDKNGKIIREDIEEEIKYVDVSSFENITLEIEKILLKYNVQSLNVYNHRIPPHRRFKLSALT